MQNQMFRSVLHFFEGTGRVISTPSGDARGLVRVYQTSETVRTGPEELPRPAREPHAQLRSTSPGRTDAPRRLVRPAKHRGSRFAFSGEPAPRGGDMLWDAVGAPALTFATLCETQSMK